MTAGKKTSGPVTRTVRRKLKRTWSQQGFHVLLIEGYRKYINTFVGGISQKMDLRDAKLSHYFSAIGRLR